MSTDKWIPLLDDFQNVLEKQTQLTRKGSINNVETLTQRAGLLMEKVAESGILGLPEFKSYRENLQRSYENLCLALAAQKAEIAEELSLIRKGKRTIRTYRHNV
jgi:hypothetical protein